MLKLLDYQEKSIDKLRNGFANHTTQMLYAPTGAGKTETAISILEASALRGNKIAMIMDRRILVEQTSERLTKYGIKHGVMMAKTEMYRPDELIQICSAQTLEAMESFPYVKMLIIDEAHQGRKSINDFIKARKIRAIGLSASPFTKGLGHIYSNVVNTTTTRELVDSGMLAPLKVFIARQIDMKGAAKVAGEWSPSEVTNRAKTITGDVVAEWEKKTHELFGKPAKTIVFCAGVAHGEDLQHQFSVYGYNFINISYKDDDDYKKEVLKDFSRPDSKINGIIATDILTKGFDQADVMIGVSARPFSKSFSSHVQQLGRIMRPHADKSHAVWLDFSGNYIRFRDDWDKLYHEGVDKLDNHGEKAKVEPTDKVKEASTCPKCKTIWEWKTTVCANCGYEKVRSSGVEVLAGSMAELDAQLSAPPPETPDTKVYTLEFKKQFYGELLGYVQKYGMKPGYAFFKYQEKFKEPPKLGQIAPIPPSQNMMKWILSRQIAYQQSKKRK
jgi:superfamily II DNA or RNA helicase